MKVYYGVEEFEQVESAVVTSGTFDGVHIGHKTIINRLKKLAEKTNGQTVLLSFHPHPRLVLYPKDNDLRLLNTLEEKIELLDKAGIDHLILQKFTKKFSRLSSVEYIRDILVNQIGVKKMVIGYDHRFGKNREGSLSQLKEAAPIYGFDVEEIPAKEIEEVNVSSTKIRKALFAGDIETANEYLGYNYLLTGKITEGNKIGKNLGFPTANIKVEDKHKLIPANGVYATRVNYKNTFYKGMMNIGTRPTFNSSEERNIEVHILDFDQEIYGEELTVQIKSKLRDEKKFDGKEELKKQLEIDRNKTLQLL